MKKLIALCLLTVSVSGAERTVFITPDQVAKVLPVGLKLKEGKHWQPQVAALSNQVLKNKAVGALVRWSLPFVSLESRENTTYGAAVLGRADVKTLTFAGAEVEARIYVCFTPDQLEKLGSLSTRRVLTFAGFLKKAEFSSEGRIITLDVTHAALDSTEASAGNHGP